MTGRVLDLTDRIFGKLTALYPVRGNGTNKRLWACRCECGNMENIHTFQLTSGKRTGCRDFKCRSSVKIGDKFGKLTVVDLIQSTSRGRTKALCECFCGKMKTTFVKNLQRGASIDCGCGRSERLSQSRKKDEMPQLLKRLLDSYKRGAKVRHLPFTLTEDHFKLLVTSSCFYCDTPPTNTKQLRNVVLYWNGIDRKDNSLGYIESNVVSCCSDCNYMKNSRNFDTFLEKIKVIYSKVILTQKES